MVGQSLNGLESSHPSLSILLFSLLPVQHSLQLSVSRLTLRLDKERVRVGQSRGGKVRLLRCFAIKWIREVSWYLEN